MSHLFALLLTLVPITSHPSDSRSFRSIVNQALLLSQSIADSFHQSKPGAHTVLVTVDFAKAFDSVWHSSLFSKLLSLVLHSTLSNGYDLISQIDVRKSVPVILIVVLSVFVEVSPKVLFLDQSFYPFINDFPAFLPSSVKVSLYSDNLAVWASFPNVERATAVVQVALNKLVEWSSKWRLPLNPLKCEPSLLSLDPYQPHLPLTQIRTFSA